MFNDLMELIKNSTNVQASMALISGKIGHENSASAILHRDASVYYSSLTAGTIVKTLQEDGIVLD